MTAYIQELEDGSRFMIKDSLVPTLPSVSIAHGDGFGQMHPTREEMVELRDLIQDYLNDTADQ